ncbi:RNA 2'-phosphotransferase [Lihuaxuella thermophila]|uniref:Probable RNA 2'-phosphotransferase n=1 Tax=Lihuaxuella thermophila TaxID=1173111 RepID=A0A1H8C4Y2_9BACL|nr:RNA 2'-phosphotransferase [Lihuaxuella thermophila]SEM90120.1 putative RNA 2'-phosphotransferase [Lihuaxuella thermophila]
MSEERLIKVSKFLSFVLRHRPEKIGIQLDQAGWAEIGELLAGCQRNGFPVDRDELHKVVKSNDKRRFAISQDGQRIRAVQGHSVPVQLGYLPKQPPDRLYHGTASRFLAAIKQQGLTKQSRHHVHLSQTRAVADQVGSRRGRPVILTILAKEMAEAGYVFYRSDNDVWLVGHVPAEYIQFPDETG